MKPSETKAGRRGLRETAKPLPSNLSRDANPPLTAAECETAQKHYCPMHGGIIHKFPQGQHGKPFRCPMGNFWRFDEEKGADNQCGAEGAIYMPPITYREDASIV
jgi:hypothetical protein